VNVLHVVSTGDRRGAEVFASDLVRSFDERGADQQVIVIRASGAGDIAYRAKTTVLGRDGQMVRLLRLDPRRVNSLRRLMNRTKPDVVQAHGGEALKYAVVAGRAGTTPIVYRKIGRIHPSATRGIRLIAHRKLVARATRVVIVAEALRRETREILGVPDHLITYIPNAVDRRRMGPTATSGSVRRGLGIPPDATVLLSVAALTWEKDPIAHLEVAARSLRSCPQAFFVLMGDGPLRPDVEDAVRMSDVKDRIVLVAPRPDVANVLCASEVLLLASRTEGMPASVIEAGMSGVPAAAFSVAGVPEVVEDGRTGLLAEEGDVEELAARATKLLQDGDLRVALGRAAKTRCLSSFDIGSVATRYLEVYDMLGRRP
jgi:glycosyltransferase involved in cell wall biosynthesis